MKHTCLRILYDDNETSNGLKMAADARIRLCEQLRIKIGKVSFDKILRKSIKISS